MKKILALFLLSSASLFAAVTPRFNLIVDTSEQTSSEGLVFIQSSSQKLGIQYTTDGSTAQDLTGATTVRFIYTPSDQAWQVTVTGAVETATNGQTLITFTPANLNTNSGTSTFDWISDVTDGTSTMAYAYGKLKLIENIGAINIPPLTTNRTLIWTDYTYVGELTEWPYLAGTNITLTATGSNGQYLINASAADSVTVSAGSNVTVVTNGTDYAISASAGATILAGTNVTVTTNGTEYTINSSATSGSDTYVEGSTYITVTTNGTTNVVSAASTLATDAEVTATSNGLVNAYTEADTVVSNGVTTAFGSADTVVSNGVTVAFGAADTVVSNGVTVAFTAADTVVSNGVTSAFTSADTIVSNGVTAAFQTADLAVGLASTNYANSVGTTVSNGLTIAYTAKDTVVSNGLTIAYKAADVAVGLASTNFTRSTAAAISNSFQTADALKLNNSGGTGTNITMTKLTMTGAIDAGKNSGTNFLRLAVGTNSSATYATLTPELYVSSTNGYTELAIRAETQGNLIFNNPTVSPALFYAFTHGSSSLGLWANTNSTWDSIMDFNATRVQSDKSIIPSSSNTVDLGSAALPWRNIYANTGAVTQLSVGNATNILQDLRYLLVDANTNLVTTLDGAYWTNFSTIVQSATTPANTFAAGTNYFAGRVGIGTAIPIDVLHISAGASGVTPHANTVVIIEDDVQPTLSFISPSNTAQSIYFGDAQDSRTGRIEYNHTISNLQFIVEGTSRVTINNTGNVGFKTNAPQSTVDINGVLSLREVAAPGAGATNSVRIYVDAADGDLKAVDDNGEVLVIGDFTND